MTALAATRGAALGPLLAREAATGPGSGGETVGGDRLTALLALSVDTTLHSGERQVHVGDAVSHRALQRLIQLLLGEIAGDVSGVAADPALLCLRVAQRTLVGAKRVGLGEKAPPLLQQCGAIGLDVENRART